jgi:hypothetical protein
MGREMVAGLALPGEQLIPSDAGVLSAREDGNRTVQGLSRVEAIAFHDGNVGSQDGQKDLHNLGIAEKLFGYPSVNPVQFLEKLRVRERRAAGCALSSRSGARRPERKSQAGLGSPSRWSLRTHSKARSEPMLCPKTAKGVSSQGLSSRWIASTSWSRSVYAGSEKRASRPGSRTEHVCTEAGSEAFQEWKSAAPPPA